MTPRHLSVMRSRRKRRGRRRARGARRVDVSPARRGVARANLVAAGSPPFSSTLAEARLPNPSDAHAAGGPGELDGDLGLAALERALERSGGREARALDEDEIAPLDRANALGATASGAVSAPANRTSASGSERVGARDGEGRASFSFAAGLGAPGEPSTSDALVSASIHATVTARAPASGAPAK